MKLNIKTILLCFFISKICFSHRSFGSDNGHLICNDEKRWPFKRTYVAGAGARPEKDSLLQAQEECNRLDKFGNLERGGINLLASNNLSLDFDGLENCSTDKKNEATSSSVYSLNEVDDDDEGIFYGDEDDE